MIEVCWHREHQRLTVRGHARSGEEGKDLICAGASTLTVTMAANVEAMDKRGLLYSKEIRLDKGDAEIQFTPKAKFRSVAQLTAEAVLLGFYRLAAQYPGYIQVVCLG